MLDILQDCYVYVIIGKKNCSLRFPALDLYLNSVRLQQLISNIVCKFIEFMSYLFSTTYEKMRSKVVIYACIYSFIKIVNNNK